MTIDILSYAIMGGVSAKVIKDRFDEEMILKLLKYKRWDKGQDWIKTHVDEFDDVNKIIAKTHDEL